MTSQFIVDTAGLIALTSGLDQYHQLAKNLWAKSIQQSLAIVSKISVIEAVTAIQENPGHAQTGRSLAILVGQYLRGLEQTGIIRIINPTPNEEKHAWENFDNAEVSEMTISECLCLTIARRRKMERVFSSKVCYQSYGLDSLLIG